MASFVDPTEEYVRLHTGIGPELEGLTLSALGITIEDVIPDGVAELEIMVGETYLAQTDLSARAVLRLQRIAALLTGEIIYSRWIGIGAGDEAESIDYDRDGLIVKRDDCAWKARRLVLLIKGYERGLLETRG
jgi:hypothetical protein